LPQPKSKNVEARLRRRSACNLFMSNPRFHK
jgi:hypothetical protein